MHFTVIFIILHGRGNGGNYYSKRGRGLKNDDNYHKVRCQALTPASFETNFLFTKIVELFESSLTGGFHDYFDDNSSTI